MTSLHDKILIKACKLFDLLVMVCAFSLATLASYEQSGIVSFADFLTMRIKIQNFALFLGFLVVWHIDFSLFKLYQLTRFSTWLKEATAVIKAVAVGTLLFIVVSVFLNIKLMTPVFFTVFAIVNCLMTISTRVVLKFIHGYFWFECRNPQHILIVGTNARAMEFAKKIEKRPELGYRLIGFVDDKWPGLERLKEEGYVPVSDFQHFRSFLRDHIVDEILISLPMKSLYDQSSKIVALCEEQGITVRHLSNPFNLKQAQTKADELDSDAFVTIQTGAMQGMQMLIKRMLDFFIASVLILLFFPLFFIVVLSIKIISPGPVFFVQERVGLNKRRFQLYKFRTMVQDAEKKLAELEALNEASGPVFKIKKDPRITTIGKFLRKTSIDELPQLFNVLRGDMSLVGPRPLPVRDYNGFNKDWHRRRFSVRPGLTCLWQVNGRSNINFDRWMELDLDYIDNWSLGLDFKILVRTIPAVLRGSGAT